MARDPQEGPRRPVAAQAVRRLRANNISKPAAGTMHNSAANNSRCNPKIYTADILDKTKEYKEQRRK